MEYERQSSSLKHKLKSSICLSCCFHNHRHETLGTDDNDKPRLIRSSSLWLRSKAHELPEIREKCRNLISRIGRSRRHSADFSYDPLSYALNFDEGSDDARIDEFPFRNFSARLPASPPRKSVAPPQVVVTRGIVACS